MFIVELLTYKCLEYESIFLVDFVWNQLQAAAAHKLASSKIWYPNERGCAHPLSQKMMISMVKLIFRSFHSKIPIHGCHVDAQRSLNRPGWPWRWIVAMSCLCEDYTGNCFFFILSLFFFNFIFYSFFEVLRIL